ncbi:uncharacterized protein LOC108734590 isoform X2 [Agrilus planipennis]|nr:uncharacterized protein LOC108734590 isoform X2 [Agrilus planipennis]XP_018321718.1 uncharacterized protein LOC108734590 isoform X2 [Agrilus planipennis]XP_018321719.1 uncharacterized protein LOC108734590 isoform X2 [Agrilus planipennis]
MGGSNSKSELSRRKSFIRRSSQRTLFQTAKRHLASISRRIDKLQSTEKDGQYTDLRSQLEEVQKELDSVSDILKDKHREKYEESQKYLRDTFEKLEAKLRENMGITDIPEENPSQEVRNSIPTPTQEAPPTVPPKPKVQLSLLKVLPTPENSETKGNPLRTPKTPEMENGESELAKTPTEEDIRASRASKYSKFGIQVLPPVLPHTRLTMLLETKRNQSEDSVDTTSPPETPQFDLKKREKYRPSAPGVPQTPSFDSQPPSPAFFRKSESNPNATSPVLKRISGKHTTTEGRAISPLVIPRDPVFQNGTSEPQNNQNLNGYKIIKDAQEYTEHLERQLKQFKGNKDDETYFYLQEGFFQNLMKLDTIDPADDAVLRQEKKLSIKKVEELVKLLDMKVTASLNNEVAAESSDDDVFDEYEPIDKKNSLCSNGKTAVITHL